MIDQAQLHMQLGFFYHKPRVRTLEVTLFFIIFEYNDS